MLTSPSLSFGDRDFRTFSFGDWWSFPFTHLGFLGFSLRLACGTAFSSVRKIINVSLLERFQGEPEECSPWTRRTGVSLYLPCPEMYVPRARAHDGPHSGLRRAIRSPFCLHRRCCRQPITTCVLSTSNCYTGTTPNRISRPILLVRGLYVQPTSRLDGRID